MRIAHLHNELDNKGGTEVYLAQLQELLPRYGHQSYWITIQEFDESWRWCIQGGRWKQCEKKTLVEGVRSWILATQIDVLCIHNLFDNAIVDELAGLLPTIKFSHSPIVVCPGKDKYWRYSDRPCTIPYGLHCFYHAYTEGCTNRHPKRLLPAYSFVGNEIKRARSIYFRTVVMSEYNADRLTECGIPSEKVLINPYFTTPVKGHSQLSSSGTIELLYIGRIIRGKGVEHLISAVEPLLKGNKGIKLNIIGDGILLNHIREMVGEKGITESVKFHGWLGREEIDRYLKSCYLLVFPSTYPESFGIVGIEAMMAGKPVVAFNVGGVSTWLRDKETGFLCSAGKTAEMEQAIRELIDNPEVYKRMSENARSSAIKNFLPERHMKALDDVFNEAVSTSPKSILTP